MSYRTGVLVALLAVPLLAQPDSSPIAGPTSKAVFDVTGLSSLAEAQTLVVKGYADGSAVGVLLTGLSCAPPTDGGTYVCSVNLPALVPGAHTLAVTVTLNGRESPASNTIGFTYIVLSVGNLRIR